tara:strand:+ start:348 stop:782 length:435 start_codon:yes stop_codon:yes gene_type:complete
VNSNLLALIVAAIWGLAPIFEKMSLKELNPMLVLFVRFVLVSCLILPFYLTSNSLSSILSLSFKNILLILIPGVLAVLGIYLYFNALMGSSASKIVPLTAIYPLFTCFYGYLFLKEQITIETIIGTSLIIIGVFVLNYSEYFKG